jgi:hypothetical protein
MNNKRKMKKKIKIIKQELRSGKKKKRKLFSMSSIPNEIILQK